MQTAKENATKKEIRNSPIHKQQKVFTERRYTCTIFAYREYIMLKKIKQFIIENSLLSESDRVLVALSGGPDSVCLLLALRELGYSIAAAHCNFQLRGKESERDEKFVRLLCDELGIQLHLTHFDTTTYAQEQRVSIEMAARELRYGFFSKMMREKEYTKTAVAHHSDDNIETMLINLMRGTGIKGMRGILPKNGQIVRPLLCCNREEILSYLKAQRQDYVTDSTNLATDFIRNKIRLQLIPLMQTIVPSVKNTLITTISNLMEESKVYNSCIKRMEEECSFVDNEGTLRISKEGLWRSPSPISLLHETLEGCGFNRTQLKQIISSLDKTGKRFFTQQFQLYIDRDYLYVSEIDDTPVLNTTISVEQAEGRFDLPYGMVIRYHILSVDKLNMQEDNAHAYFDLKKTGTELSIRPCCSGDRFVPFGMRGSKLVSDLLTDLKLPATEKERQLVLTSGERIAWVVGRRSSNEFRIDEGTTKVLEMQVIKSMQE